MSPKVATRRASCTGRSTAVSSRMRLRLGPPNMLKISHALPTRPGEDTG